ncbi:tRNA pseudouridine(38-40) synthase TruA [Membranihabitans marinus]|uniref:tRNA pseudouridine(38-40) synthase TruA n=1 Tax=Membranihabitans marinus TaxID=1227546 RepID=UPI001F022673|nr:tRNA pseudouridine(38-40) synthase TruA [Membranihabitans marinus]
MRYFIHLTYKGSHYSGWQSQPNAQGVQGVIEDRLSRILRSNIAIVGCGRTDTGVHASDYYAHFDTDAVVNDELVFRLNNFLPQDIAVYDIIPVEDHHHARFNALRRSYIYNLHFQKNPFLQDRSFYYYKAKHFDVHRLNEMSELLLSYGDFYPFCKLHSDVNNYRCQLSRCHWKAIEGGYEMHISADRFLRGMVRLIVGASLLYAEGKIQLSGVKTAMDEQSRLEKNWSVPPQGLFLSKIEYPFIESSQR